MCHLWHSTKSEFNLLLILFTPVMFLYANIANEIIYKY